MGKVIGGMTISLDGFVEDKDGSVERLYPNLKELAEAEALQASMRDTGAVVMGRHSYEMANGDYTGYEFQTPIFVLTHDVPVQPAKGENDNLKFHFVTDGVESAIKQAVAAAKGKDVMIVGGPSVTRQALKAGLVDELQIGVMPILFGAGLRLFENLESQEIQLEKLKSMDSPGGRTELYFRVVK